MNFKIEFSYKTDIGKVRKNNEDSLLVEPKIGLAIVADGMGGHKSGEIASKLAVEVTKEKYESVHYTNLKPNPYNEEFSLETNQLLFAAQLANSVVYEAAVSCPENKGMGTTLSAILLNKNKISFVHVGDSRIYLFKNNKLEQITEDHSLVMDHVRKGLLSREEAEKSPLQNILTRAIGTQKQINIDAGELDVEDGERFLLCTDGLFKTVPEQQIINILSQNPDNGNAVEIMIESANTNGGMDNITIIMGSIKKKNVQELIKGIFK